MDEQTARAVAKADIFDELFNAASKLAAGVDNYGATIDEQFEGMFKDPLRELQSVLERCPAPEQWDGTLRDRDIEVTYFRPEVGQTPGTPDKGVRMRHRVTGITRESYTKLSREENQGVARRALEKAVKDRWQQRQP